MNNKIEINFVCYAYTWNEGAGTMFQFFPDGVWDEDKLTIEEALKNYPIGKYEWIESDSERLTTLEQLLENIIAASCGHYADVDTNTALQRAITKADEFLNT